MSDKNIFRVGRISSVNYEKGKVRIVYNDKDKAVTKEMPMFSSEYHMPAVDDLVTVMHLPNGTEVGVVLGRVWTGKNNRPPEGFEGLYRKDLSRKNGKCMIRYEDTEEGEGNSGELKIHNDDDILVEAKNMKAETDADIELKSDGSVSISGSSSVKVHGDGSVEIRGGHVTITGAVKIDGITFSAHTHNCTAPGSPSGPPIGA